MHTPYAQYPEYAKYNTVEALLDTLEGVMEQLHNCQDAKIA